MKPQIEAGELAVVGLIQEQHPERTILFNQWKKIPMKLLADPLNQLEVAVVPITLLIDEQGTIRYRNPKPSDVTTFLSKDYQSQPAAANSSSGYGIDQGAEWVLQNQFGKAINHYEQELKKNPKESRLEFRLG
ncbi:MAG: hypothetical protein AAF939_20690, partial [Planctomycetota bacterium]